MIAYVLVIWEIDRAHIVPAEARHWNREASSFSPTEHVRQPPFPSLTPRKTLEISASHARCPHMQLFDVGFLARCILMVAHVAPLIDVRGGHRCRGHRSRHIFGCRLFDCLLLRLPRLDLFEFLDRFGSDGGQIQSAPDRLLPRGIATLLLHLYDEGAGLPLHGMSSRTENRSAHRITRPTYIARVLWSIHGMVSAASRLS